ncbi:MAG TPA: DNA alkylation repair protein [Saprospiraceae bacterium]|jgi:3-methyladenine DNA glycosylase AlkD|nr:MAG: DNA alkylation repair protein [Candidatus Parvibacillus calidus]MBX2937810.1 DNA alkylation repair protein [Saprospiraceae bacterium]HNS13523.1 DNA alkylation repair protein [Bacteroidia bacterium]HQN93179.1 DNA alkylation repair protein [Prolixibacteraceae bacterium]MBK7740041.1 DNA alkylation repair protein [Candidatus Parvibacillus calidus]
MTPEIWISELQSQLAGHRNQANAVHIIRYLKGQFGSFGIKQGERRLIVKPFIKNARIFDTQALTILLELLWQNEEREFQYTGMELLDTYRKKFGKDIKKPLEQALTEKSWWDTVDFLATHTAGRSYQDGMLTTDDLYAWNSSGNIWLIRTSILTQLKYKSSTDWEMLQQFILPHLLHKDFFIRKGIGWALREYAKTEPARVRSFVEHHEMSGLSRREALKNLYPGGTKR